MATMNALRAHRRGGPEVLVYEQAPIPTPGDDEVLVAVHAAAITFDELTWEPTWERNGKDRTPIIPSHEFCGEVVVLGSGVTSVIAGESVYGMVPWESDGAAAEFVAVPATQVAARPTSLSAVEAAALPLPALTAQQALFDHADLQEGDRVLVLGGAGGVGGYVVQMAAAAGADVTATSRGAIDYVRELGARRVIDVRSEPVEGNTYDVVIDTVSGEVPYALVREGGRLVTLQTPPDEAKAEKLGIKAAFFIVTADTEQLTRLARRVDEQGLRVTIAATFPLEQGAAAFASRSTHGPGKTVLTVK
jgi:NADPH:quinone reductase-like Zn-dependent oxidoreductase